VVNGALPFIAGSHFLCGAFYIVLQAPADVANMVMFAMRAKILE